MRARPSNRIPGAAMHRVRKSISPEVPIVVHTEGWNKCIMQLGSAEKHGSCEDTPSMDRYTDEALPCLGLFLLKGVDGESDERQGESDVVMEGEESMGRAAPLASEVPTLRSD